MVLRTALRAVIIAVGTLFVGIAGALVGVQRGDLNVALVLRTALVIALVTALTRAFRMRDRGAADHAGRPYHQVLVAAGLAYIVNISSWGGHTLIGQLWVPAGFPSALIDFVLWMAVAMVGVRLGDHPRVQTKAAPVPYA